MMRALAPYLAGLGVLSFIVAVTATVLDRHNRRRR